MQAEHHNASDAARSFGALGEAQRRLAISAETDSRLVLAKVTRTALNARTDRLSRTFAHQSPFSGETEQIYLPEGLGRNKSGATLAPAAPAHLTIPPHRAI